MPLVSVILPFRNSERFLRASIESVRAQDFHDFELLAVDDGSEDASDDVVAAAGARDPRVRLVSAGRLGLPGALNEGCRRASGEFLARMDADDLAMPWRLSQQVAALQASSDLVVIGGAIDLIDESDLTVGETWYAGSDAAVRAVLEQGTSPFCHPATTIRRAAFEAVGGYRPACELAEDLDIWLRLAKAGTLGNLDSKVLRYRLHPLSASFDRIGVQVASHYRALILNDAARSEANRALALATNEIWPLVQSWAPGQPAAHLAMSTSWHVDWAVTGGYDPQVGSLIDAIAAFAPAEDRPTVAWTLWQHATVAALAAGRAAVARTHLESGRAALLDAGRVETEHDALEALRSAVDSRLDCRATSVPPPAARDGGYLDSVQWLDGGRRLVITGWIARSSGDSETVLLVHLDRLQPSSTQISPVLRPDVANVMGPGHLIAGFKADLRFDVPVLAEPTTVRASVRYPGGRAALLEDTNVRVHHTFPGPVTRPREC